MPLQSFIESSNLYEELSNTEIFILSNIAKTYKDGKLIEQIQALIDELTSLTPVDLFPENINAVSLLTLHSSKGLEFPVVFIAGFDEGLIPYTLTSDTDIEEERRLFYVGMTRAMDELILIHSRQRLINGKKITLPVSSFLKDIPEEYVIKKVRQNRAGPKQKALFLSFYLCSKKFQKFSYPFRMSGPGRRSHNISIYTGI